MRFMRTRNGKHGSALLIAAVFVILVLLAAACSKTSSGGRSGTAPAVSGPAETGMDDAAKDEKYQEAMSAFKNKKYSKAYELFAAIAGYSDSEYYANRSLYLLADSNYKNNQYDDAIMQFEKLGSFSDSAERVLACKYKKARSLVSKSMYDDAIAIYREIGNYSDSQEQLRSATYQKAKAAYGKKQYQEAYDLYSSLGEYSDSAKKAKDSLLALGESKYKDGKYDEAIEVLETLGDYSTAKSSLRNAKEKKAEQYEKSGDYLSAFNLYQEIGRTSDRNNVVNLWAAAALKAPNIDAARQLTGAVSSDSISSSSYRKVITDYLNEHESHRYWYSDGKPTTQTLIVQELLRILPATAAADSQLKQLFDILAAQDAYKELFLHNKDVAEGRWKWVAFVRDMAASDEGLVYFLEGKWSNSGGTRHLVIDSEGNASFTLPAPGDPEENDSFFKGMTYYFVYEGSSTPVFRFELRKNNYNYINVYCYSDNRTYSLSR